MISRSVVAVARPGMQAHASSIVVEGATILVAWFEGPHEGSESTEICLAIARSPSAFHRLGSLKAVDGLAHWNPVLWRGPDGKVWLFFKVGARIDQWRTFVSKSGDHGYTWSRACELVRGDSSGGRGPVRQAPVLWNGKWVAGGSTESWAPLRWDCFADVLRDEGGPWRKYPMPLEHARIPGAGCIQPWLVPTNEQLLALARSTGGRVYRASSPDGIDWSSLEPTSLPNNNSGIAAAALPDGRVICVHNNAGENWGERRDLVLSLSEDGRVWRTIVVLEPLGDLEDLSAGPAGASGRPRSASARGVRTRAVGEFSYPSLALSDERIFVTYSWQRRAIALACLPIGLLK